MQDCPWKFLRDGRRHIICLVGGGGKTTLMYQLADFFAACDRKVQITTPTHIWRPEKNYAADAPAVQYLWAAGSYAVIGSEEQGTHKLIAPEKNFFSFCREQADIVLAEADGAKGMPVKVPAAHEPVLLPDCDIVIGVAGMDALGRTAQEACLRWQLLREIIPERCGGHLLRAQEIAALLLSAGGTRKNVGGRVYCIALNKCELAEAEQVLRLKNLLLRSGMDEENIWLRSINSQIK